MKILSCDDAYEKFAVTEKFIKDSDVLTRHCMCVYRRGEKEPNLHSLVLYATTLLWLPWHDSTSKWPNPTTTKPLTDRGKPRRSYNLDVTSVQSEFISFPSAFKRWSSGKPATMLDSTPQSAPSDAGLSLLVRLDASSTVENAAYWKVCFSKDSKPCNMVSSRRTGTKLSRASSTPTLNCVWTVRIVQTNERIEEVFEAGIVSIKAIPCRRQECPRQLQPVPPVCSSQLARAYILTKWFCWGLQTAKSLTSFHWHCGQHCR